MHDARSVSQPAVSKSECPIGIATGGIEIERKEPAPTTIVRAGNSRPRQARGHMFFAALE